MHQFLLSLEWHPRRNCLPQQCDFPRSQTIGGIDQFAEPAFKDDDLGFALLKRSQSLSVAALQRAQSCRGERVSCPGTPPAHLTYKSLQI